MLHFLEKYANKDEMKNFKSDHFLMSNYLKCLISDIDLTLSNKLDWVSFCKKYDSNKEK